MRLPNLSPFLEDNGGDISFGGAGERSSKVLLLGPFVSVVALFQGWGWTGSDGSVLSQEKHWVSNAMGSGHEAISCVGWSSLTTPADSSRATSVVVLSK